MDSPLVVWDKLEAYLRGFLMAVISRIKKESGKQEKASIAMVEKSKRDYILDPTLSNRDKWSRAQERHKLYTLQQAERKHFFFQHYFEEGENMGHLLASVAKSQSPQAHVSLI